MFKNLEISLPASRQGFIYKIKNWKLKISNHEAKQDRKIYS